MKTKLCLLLGLFTITTAFAQEFTDPGWYNETGAIDVQDMDLTANSSFGPSDMVGSGQPAVSIAEAATPAIQALARGLENDPVRIFNFVHDHIRHVLYFGSKKGAQLTLLEGSGNDFDQCALLVSLLRSANYTNVGYQFGFMKMPYDSSDHNDLHHWLELKLPNTNWTSTGSYFGSLLGIRGYPALFNGGDNNTLVFQRVWVALQIGSTNYYLDPAFKRSEPIAGIDLTNAMGLSSNAIWTAAGGTATADYVQSLDEGAIRGKLRDFTTNLLASLNSNYPNASVEQIIGGSYIVPSTNTGLNTTPFQTYIGNGSLYVLDWSNEPTNLMSKLTLDFRGTNYQWLMPQFQGQRLSLTFDSNAVLQVWQDDSNLVQAATSGSNTMPVTLTINHPFGLWDNVNNVLVDTGKGDLVATALYQRTNATYALLYAFDASMDELRARQSLLDMYRQQNLGDTSRQVLSESLNVMGLTWLTQTELATRALATQAGLSKTFHNRFGRMGQENGSGNYVDVYSQLLSSIPVTGLGTADLALNSKATDLFGYFASAFEHGLLEQLQSTNLVAASSIRMIEIASTNGQKIFLASSTNWTSITNQLSHYNLSDLASNYINLNYTLLLPANGSNHVAGGGSWAGYGLFARFVDTNGSSSQAKIQGNYHGGYSAYADSTPDTSYIVASRINQADAFSAQGFSQYQVSGADPVDMADGSFTVNETDLTLGQAEPRGFSFGRYYSPTRRFHNLAGLGAGWVNTYYFDLAEVAAPEAGLGLTTPQQAASFLVATRAALELYNPTPNAKNWTITTLITKWGIDQVVSNGVSITLGKDTIQFVKQPDGTFTPPANCTYTLAKTNLAYTLHERHGRALKFDNKGNLTNIVDQYNRSLKMTYNSSNWVTQATDWTNHTLNFNYTGTPLRLSSISNSAGPKVVFGYTTNAGQLDLTSVTDPENQTHTFIYDTNHQIIVAKDALAQIVSSNVYDSFGRVTTQYSMGDLNKAWQLYWTGFENVEQDATGSKTRYSYDDKHRLIATQDALTNRSQTFYDGQDHVVMSVSPLNETNQYFFDANHNLTEVIDPLGFTNGFVYDSAFNMIQSTDPRGNPSHFGYNAKFQLTGSTNGAGDWATLAYGTLDGLPSSRTDAGGITTYTYNTNGYVQTVTYPGTLGSEGFMHNVLGDVIRHTNALGFITTNLYNQRRQLTNSMAPSNVVSRIFYDPVGNVLATVDPRGNAISNAWSATRKPLNTILPGTPQGTPVIGLAYDSRDWLIRTTNALRKTTQIGYDAARHQINIADPLSRTNFFGFDGDGRKTAATNAALEITRQTWDQRGQPIQTLTPKLSTISYVHDPAGNQTTITNRNTNRWQFQFDGANRLTNTITPLNRQTRLNFDSRGLLTSINPPSSNTIALFYDAKGRLTNSVIQSVGRTNYYDPNDNLTNVIEGTRSNVWTFDAYNRASTYRDADNNFIQYRYDSNGNLTNLIYPGGKVVKYFYDALNRMTNVTDWANRQTSLTYDLANRPIRISHPNGTFRIINYDDAGQTTNIIEQAASGAGVAFYKLKFENAGRVQWEFAAPLPRTNATPARTNTFDADNRLISVNGAAVTNDSDGNITWGPLTNGTAVSYNYDARNRLLSADGASYGYDPAGNRNSLTNGTNTIRFVVNPNAKLSQVLMRIKNGTTNYYVYGLGLSYEADDFGNTKTYHYDYRGSTIAITDDNGNVTDRAEYSAYGILTYRAGTTDTPFLYNGRYGVMTDPNGLLHMRARYFNPYLCRFINADPSGFSGGLNFYAYADGNPVSLLDPFGLGTERGGDSGSISFSGGRGDSGGVSFSGGVTSSGGGFSVGTYEPPVERQGVSWGTVALVAATVILPELLPETGPEIGAALVAERTVAGLDSGIAAAETADTIAPGLRISTYRVTAADETFIRYESANPAYTRITPGGGVTPGTFAAPASDGIIPVVDRVPTYNLPSPQIPRPTVTILRPPAGTPIIGPRPVVGGHGNEVIFPMGF